MSTELRDSLRALSRRPDGVRSCDVPGYSTSITAKAIQHLCSTGHLYRAKIGHKTVHYFDTLRRAEEFEAKHKPAVEGVKVGAYHRAAWKKDAPMVIPPGLEIKRLPPTEAGQHFRTNTYSVGSI